MWSILEGRVVYKFDILLYNNHIKYSTTRGTLLADCSSRQGKGGRRRGALWIALWLLAGLAAGCNWMEVDRLGPAALPTPPAGIIFVTATPRPELALSEGQRFSPRPTDSPPLPPPAVPAPTPPPYFAGANELGRVMVLEYHRIAYPEMRYQRSPDNFRADLQRLYERGYYPVNFIDLASGLPDVPAGKKPVVLTFDDSDISQFRVLPGNIIDVDSAVGALLNFHNGRPADWPPRATFFVLGDDTNNHYKIFGQPELAEAKVQFLVGLGMEIGSHTVNHLDLSTAQAERIYWELAVSQHVIEAMAPGYKVRSMSVPYGGFPFTLEFLKAGQWGEYSYTYAANAAAWGGPGLSPFDSNFEPYNISRLEVTDTSLDHWLAYFDQNPHEYYVADGDANRVTFPELQVSTAGE